MKETITYNEDKEKSAFVEQYFDDEGRIVYVEHWISIHDQHFSAMMETKERMEYDNLGRLTKHIIYHSGWTGKTEQHTYSYDTNGKKLEASKNIKGYLFWD